MPQDLTLKIDLNAPVTLSGCIGVLRSFLGWWSHQLTSLFPVSWRERVRQAAPTPRVTILEDGWCLESEGGTPLTFGTAAIAYDVKEELARKAPLALAYSVDVILPRSDGLYKRVAIPAGALSRVRQVVRLQLDRLSPFRGDDVQFDCNIVEETPPVTGSTPAVNTEVLLEVAIVPKRRLLAVEQMLRGVGLVPKAFRLAGVPTNFAPQGLPWTKQTQSRALALSAGLLLFVAAVLLGPVMGNMDIAELTATMAAAAPQVHHAIADRDELARYRLPPQALSPDRVAVLDLILDLTKRLPDSAHITRLEVSDNVVSLQVRTSAALPVKSLLLQSPLLTHVKAVQEGDLFAVTADLRLSPAAVEQ